MKLKRGVKTDGVQPAMWFALGAALVIYQNEANAPLVVTSLNDSHEKKPKSLHHKGCAADLRTNHVSAVKVAVIGQKLHERLDSLGFDVVVEPDHIHIEYDPKQGEAWQQGGVS